MKFAEYGSLLTEAYDLDKPEPPSAQLGWHRKFIAESGEPAVALMCGSGRFLVPLVAEGLDVDGVDASPDMLGACRTKLTERGLQSNVYEQKLQDLDLPRRYRTAFVGGGGSFGLIIDRDEALEALRRIGTHLENGGRLRLEVQTPAVLPFNRIGRAHVRSWVRGDGARIVLTSSAVRVEGNVVEAIGRYELFKDRKLIETELDDFPQRLYEPDEMRALLEEASFADIVVTKAYTDEPATDEDLLVSFMARR